MSRDEILVEAMEMMRDELGEDALVVAIDEIERRNQEDERSRKFECE